MLFILMSWPPSVREEAFVLCGRHCSLCHKFCGGKIELNHIIPASDDGEWTLDNAIPLCFDCHAEVGHYNVQHPKGSKFTPAELKRHRDNWYSKVQSSGGISASEEHRQLDRVLFRRIAEVLPADGTMLSLSEFDIEGLFNFDHVSTDFWGMLDLHRRPDVEFLDEDLEAARVGLIIATNNFLNQLAKYTFKEKSPEMRDLSRIPNEWSYQNRAMYLERVNELMTLRAEAAGKFHQFIRTGRRKLGIDYKPGD